jgi:hypothetical protein
MGRFQPVARICINGREEVMMNIERRSPNCVGFVPTLTRNETNSLGSGCSEGFNPLFTMAPDRVLHILYQVAFIDTKLLV